MSSHETAAARSCFSITVAAAQQCRISLTEPNSYGGYPLFGCSQNTGKAMIRFRVERLAEVFKAVRENEVCVAMSGRLLPAEKKAKSVKYYLPFSIISDIIIESPNGGSILLF